MPGTEKDFMTLRANKYKIAFACWIAVLIVLISGVFVIRFEPKRFHLTLKTTH